MTDDIVARIRDERWQWVSEETLRNEAADEIERLREELQASQDTTRAWIEMLGEIDD